MINSHAKFIPKESFDQNTGIKKEKLFLTGLEI
jgi:hypothetical protein